MIRSIISRIAYYRFQSRIRARIKAAQSLHKPTRDIRKDQTERLHAALRNGK